MIQHLIENLLFTVGNITLKQDVVIPVGIDPTPFWANLFLIFMRINAGEKLFQTKSKFNIFIVGSNL